ncbi:hypothetical protein K1T36_09895 [Pseudomonas protegens]|uniref:hypothetical protein n=1 Tax=Pseudomonas protegens TaxID=380021 RepID=UPI001C6A338D|nr:hypothetical protein [Pseudomonas protegens]QYN03455.1 hypothetical protein K1T36_09895 [Pseudomonas protegens]
MHPFQPIIDELKAAGVKITGGESAYRLLHKLCIQKALQMNGSALRAAKSGGLPRKKVITQAKYLLNEYLKTGLIVLPEHMKIRGSEHKYKHDGDAGANRNLWRTGWKAPTPKDNTHHGFNTVKG